MVRIHWASATTAANANTDSGKRRRQISGTTSSALNSTILLSCPAPEGPFLAHHTSWGVAHAASTTASAASAAVAWRLTAAATFR